MNLFEKHTEKTQNNEVAVKASYDDLITIYMVKYIKLQKKFNEMVVITSSNKKRVAKMTANLKKQTKCNLILSEAVKSYKILFEEDYDLGSVIEKATIEHYSLIAECDCKGCQNRRKTLKKTGKYTSKASDGLDDKDMPQELKDTLVKLKKSLKDKGMDANIKVIDLKQHAKELNLDPENFSDFSDFIAAVHKAEEVQDDIDRSSSPEDFINDSVIKKTEENLGSVTNSEKLN